MIESEAQRRLLDTGPSERGWHPKSMLMTALGTGFFTEQAALAAVRDFFAKYGEPDPNIRKIPLTQGQWALVDADDFEWLSQWTWCAATQRNHLIALSKPKSHAPHLLMHRLITPNTPVVDHINGNSLDNRRSNLRAATPSQNGANARRSRANSTGFKGVYFARERNKWAARIKVNYREIGLGRFSSAEDAARAYDAAARKHFGEFAQTNFPLERK